MEEYRKNYPGLFPKVDYFLRKDNIPSDGFPGYAILQKSIVIANVLGTIEERDLLVELYKDGTFVPSNKYSNEDFDRAIVWMLDVIEVAEILPLDEKDPKRTLFKYIREIADKL